MQRRRNLGKHVILVGITYVLLTQINQQLTLVTPFWQNVSRSVFLFDWFGIAIFYAN